MRIHRLSNINTEMRTRVDTLQREAQHFQRQLELLQVEEEALRQDEEL